MQSFAFVIFGSMLFMNSAFAADSLISSHTTHPVLEALPSASPQASFQIAKTYYLPDYQQQINNVKGDSFTDRGNEDDTNRNDTCSSGGYYSSPLGSGYNCSRVVYAHQACYSCTAKPCPSGYTAGLTKCAAKTGYSASYSSNGISGTQTCGKCDYKELSCASGYSTSYQSVSNCGTTGSAGWTFTSNGYSGTKLCGKCTAKTCLSGYSKTYSDVSKCGSKGSKGWSWEKSSQYAGNSVCGKCSKLSCNSPYTSGITSCSPSDGYTLKQDSRRYNGDTVCGYCQPNNCSGTKQSDCNTSNGYTFTRTCKSGTTIYGTCKPNVCSGTKKSDCNTANGYTFTATCKSAGVNYGTCKANSCSGTAQSACNTSNGYTFTANGCISAGVKYGTCKANTCSGVPQSSCDTANGYTFTANGCISAGKKYGTCTLIQKCPTGYSTAYQSVSDCGTTGSSGWTFTSNGSVGNKVCGRCEAKPCPKPTGTTADLKCLGNNMWVAQLGKYSGDEPCGTCQAGIVKPCFCSTQVLYSAMGQQVTAPSAKTAQGCAVGYGILEPTGDETCQCFTCDIDATYNYFDFGRNDIMQPPFETCLRSCSTVKGTDQALCYTMCNAAKMKTKDSAPGGGLGGGIHQISKTYYCPPNMVYCCGNSNGIHTSAEGISINGVTFKAFSCIMNTIGIAGFPSCRPSNCASW